MEEGVEEQSSHLTLRLSPQSDTLVWTVFLHARTRVVSAQSPQSKLQVASPVYQLEHVSIPAVSLLSHGRRRSIGPLLACFSRVVNASCRCGCLILISVSDIRAERGGAEVLGLGLSSLRRDCQTTPSHLPLLHQECYPLVIRQTGLRTRYMCESCLGCRAMRILFDHFV